MGSDKQTTTDGFEMSTGVSYFGHFLMTELLLEVLKNTGAARTDGRDAATGATDEGQQ